MTVPSLPTMAASLRSFFAQIFAADMVANAPIINRGLAAGLSLVVDLQGATPGSTVSIQPEVWSPGTGSQPGTWDPATPPFQGISPASGPLTMSFQGTFNLNNQFRLSYTVTSPLKKGGQKPTVTNGSLVFWNPNVSPPIGGNWGQGFTLTLPITGTGSAVVPSINLQVGSWYPIITLGQVAGYGVQVTVFAQGASKDIYVITGTYNGPPGQSMSSPSTGGAFPTNGTATWVVSLVTPPSGTITFSITDQTSQTTGNPVVVTIP